MESDVSPETLREWIRDFEAAARRPLDVRMRYAFIRTYKPVLDDARYRSFDTMAEYRRWCEAPRTVVPRSGRSPISASTWQATGRVKDRETLPRLLAFRDWWVAQARDRA